MQDLSNFSVFGRGGLSPTHSELCRFVSGSQAKHQVSSPVIILLKKFLSASAIAMSWQDVTWSSLHSAQRICTRGKTVNAEFYKGVMDHLLKRIRQVHPAAFCSWDFLLLHDNASTHKAARVCQFVPQVENEVKRTPFCRCCWDPRSRNWWIKDDPKRGIFGSFSETVRLCKSLYIYANGAYFVY